MTISSPSLCRQSLEVISLDKFLNVHFQLKAIVSVMCNISVMLKELLRLFSIHK